VYYSRSGGQRLPKKVTLAEARAYRRWVIERAFDFSPGFRHIGLLRSLPPQPDRARCRFASEWPKRAACFGAPDGFYPVDFRTPQTARCL